RMDQVDAREPVAVAIEYAAANTHGRDARHVGAVGEGRAHHIELAFHAPDAGEHARHVVLRLDLAAAERRVALRIDRLFQFAGRIAATLERLLAHHAG